MTHCIVMVTSRHIVIVIAMAVLLMARQGQPTTSGQPKVYTLHHETVDYATAKAACQGQVEGQIQGQGKGQGHSSSSKLATPRTAAEYFRLLADIAPSLTPSESNGDKIYFFIGMNDLDRDTTFTWEDDGSEVTWVRWDRKQPNFWPKGKAMCGAVNPSHDWRLNDVACDSQRGFICEADDPRLKDLEEKHQQCQDQVKQCNAGSSSSNTLGVQGTQGSEKVGDKQSSFSFISPFHFICQNFD